MTRHLITFSGSAYEATTERIVIDGRRFGADEVWVYDDAWLRTQEFFTLPGNRWLWEHHGDRDNHKRGFGWFAWKPYILMHALDAMNDGDIVLYLDADTYPIHDFSVLYEECHRIGGIMLFKAQGCSNRHYVKRDCWLTMGSFLPPPRDTQAAVARFMLFQRGTWRVKQFLSEWLAYCVNPLATTFDESALAPEFPDLHEHRTEQAILSVLALKYGIPLYREACQFGKDQPENQELYPQLFEQVWGAGPRTDAGSSFRRIPG